MLSEDRRTTIINQSKVKDIAFFNDQFRNLLKGSGDNDLSIKGILTDDLSNESLLSACVEGFCLSDRNYTPMFDDADKSVNYLTCHDGVTLWDKVCCANFDEDYETRKKRIKLMMFVLMVSQGIPFIHGGMEFCRSKKGIVNSYNSPDSINMYDWNLLDLNYDINDFLKKLISFRKENYAFRFSRSEDIAQHVYSFVAGNNLFVYELYNLNLDYKKMTIFINPTSSYQEYKLEQANEIIFDETGKVEPGFMTDCVSLPSLGFIVIGQKNDQ